jgi:hypothetical protein
MSMNNSDPEVLAGRAVSEEPASPQPEVKPAPAGTTPAQPRIDPLPAEEASSEPRVISSWSEEEKFHVEALTTILSGLIDLPEIERGSALLGALPNDVLAAAALIFLDEDDVVDHPAMQALMAAVCFIFGDESVGWDKPNEGIIALIQRVAYACVIELARRLELLDEQTIPWPPPDPAEMDFRFTDPLVAKLWRYSGNMGALRLFARLSRVCAGSPAEIVEWASGNLPSALAREVKEGLSPEPR